MKVRWCIAWREKKTARFLSEIFVEEHFDRETLRRRTGSGNVPTLSYKGNTCKKQTKVQTAKISCTEV